MMMRSSALIFPSPLMSATRGWPTLNVAPLALKCFINTVSAYCHTPSDECLNDNDCGPNTHCDFDTKAKEASAFLGATDQRLKMFQDAEKILVTDVPGVFIYHETPIQLFKPYVKGDALLPDKFGNKSLHWPGYTTATLAPNGFYMTKDVSKRKT